MTEGVLARHAAVAALLLAAALFCGGRVDTRFAALRLPHAGDRPSLEARLAAAGAVRRAGADRRWMDLLQYCGDRSFHLDHGDRLAALAGRITDLDPTFVPAYVFAGSMLMWTAGRPRESVALLEKGIRLNPRSVKLKYYLAAFTYYQLKDLAAEIPVLDALARDPGAPTILRHILVNAWEKQGRRDRALAVLRLIWLSGPDAPERRWVEAKLMKYGSSVAEIEH